MSGPVILEVKNYLPYHIWSPPRGVACLHWLEFRELAAFGIPRNLYENYVPETKNHPIYYGQPHCTRKFYPHYAPAGHQGCPGKVQRKIQQSEVLSYTLRTASGAEQRPW